VVDIEKIKPTNARLILNDHLENMRV